MQFLSRHRYNSIRRLLSTADNYGFHPLGFNVG